MFHYLENPNIPKTNNDIEGYFSHLKIIWTCTKGVL